MVLVLLVVLGRGVLKVVRRGGGGEVRAHVLLHVLQMLLLLVVGRTGLLLVVVLVRFLPEGRAKEVAALPLGGSAHDGALVLLLQQTAHFALAHSREREYTEDRGDAEAVQEYGFLR
jgi:hypothetical protein